MFALGQERTYRIEMAQRLVRMLIAEMQTA
jgi:hypothetical protein